MVSNLKRQVKNGVAEKGQSDDDAAKLGLDRVMQMRVATIYPSPENDLLYKPIDPADPEFAGLVESVRVDGVREPLTITTDRFILSGHRRYAAAVLAGLKTVPCITKDVARTDYGKDDYVALLGEHNRQRVKSIDEAIREEIARADPREARSRIKEHRQRKSHIDTIQIDLGADVKKRWKISASKRPFLESAVAAIFSLEAFLPVTLRQIHYTILNNPPLRNLRRPDSTYRNDKKSYQDLSNLLLRARTEGVVSWEAIADPTRPIIEWNCHRGIAPFLAEQIDRFGKGYARSLQQSQPCHIEILGEKNTIKGVIDPVASEYCIPYTLGRGYASGTPRREMRRRFQASGKDKLVLLILSDFDPEGEDIARSFALSMRDEFDAKDIAAIKVCLTHAQVIEMGLHPQMVAKEKSSRRKLHVEKYGENVWELEAVPPERLQQMLRDKIDAVLDLDAYNQELDKEAAETIKLQAWLKHASKVFADMPAA